MLDTLVLRNELVRFVSKVSPGWFPGTLGFPFSVAAIRATWSCTWSLR